MVNRFSKQYVSVDHVFWITSLLIVMRGPRGFKQYHGMRMCQANEQPCSHVCSDQGRNICCTLDKPGRQVIVRHRWSAVQLWPSVGVTNSNRPKCQTGNCGNFECRRFETKMGGAVMYLPTQLRSCRLCVSCRPAGAHSRALPSQPQAE